MYLLNRCSYTSWTSCTVEAFGTTFGLYSDGCTFVLSRLYPDINFQLGWGAFDKVPTFHCTLVRGALFM